MTKDNPKPAPSLVHEDAPDPFDPASFRLSQDFTDGASVKKLIRTVPVRKPNKHDFVRVHPDPGYRADNVGIIDFKDERETYLLHPSIAVELPGEFQQKNLLTTIARQGVVFLWPVVVLGSGGRAQEWHRSEAEAAELAQNHWIRMRANMSLGAYEIFKAQGQIPEPEWPDVTFNELLELAFRDGRVIRSFDHPAIKRLLGA
jgi:hypothetical protein